ncbi:hypothetical protein MSAN_00819300 [Mycena sanguinolenta]|uniref:Uncharacterized protein n=1 Tax=Mycena sanguinolenta TaxID=230812 RepID=A0A8H6YYJ4_9AGAR|nr:hypothetical protein MSAN_00819300 [Mycena sanguinolenta]
MWSNERKQEPLEIDLELWLPEDSCFQVSVLGSILSWLQDETSRVDKLPKPPSVAALLKHFVTAKANSPRLIPQDHAIVVTANNRDLPFAAVLQADCRTACARGPKRRLEGESGLAAESAEGAADGV